MRSSAGRFGPIQAWQQEKEAQKQLSLLVLPLPRLARTQQHPQDQAHVEGSGVGDQWNGKPVKLMSRGTN
jgi:hypothetical protein